MYCILSLFLCPKINFQVLYKVKLKNIGFIHGVQANKIWTNFKNTWYGNPCNCHFNWLKFQMILPNFDVFIYPVYICYAWEFQELACVEYLELSLAGHCCLKVLHNFCFISGKSGPSSHFSNQYSLYQWWSLSFKVWDQDRHLTIRERDQDWDQAFRDQDHPLRDQDLKNPRSRPRPHILN